MVMTDTGDIAYQPKKPSEEEVTEVPQVTGGQQSTERQNITMEVPRLCCIAREKKLKVTDGIHYKTGI